MATNVIYQYGNAAGPGPSYCKAFVGVRIAETSTTAYRLEYNHAIWIESGSDFYGIISNYSYWLNGSEVNSGQVQLYGSGWYVDATTLSGTASSLTDTTSLSNPWYRVRCLSLDGSTYSAWKTCRASSSPQLFVFVPAGKTIKGVYVWK